ncbi:MAG: ATP-binding protein [Bacteroidia bacterium]|nr:ATP-binding protein [Bacteroidia bacterium]
MKFWLRLSFAILLLWSANTVCAQGTVRLKADSLKKIFYSDVSIAKKENLSMDIASHYLSLQELDSTEKYAQYILFSSKKANNRLRSACFEVLATVQTQRLNFELADSLFDQAINLAVGDSQLIAVVLEKSVLLYRTGQYKAIMELLDPLKAKIIANGTDHQKFAYYNNMSFYYINQGDLKGELETLLSAREAMKNASADDNFVINHNLATFYIRINQFEEAKKIGVENLQLVTENKLSRRKLFAYYLLLNVASLQENYEDAKFYGLKAIEYAHSIAYYRALGFAYSSLSDLFLKSGKTDSALYYIEKSIEHSIKENERRELGKAYHSKGVIWMQLGDTSKAFELFNKGLALQTDFDREQNYDVSLAFIYQGEFKKSYGLLEENVATHLKEEDENTIYTLFNRLLKEKYEKELEINNSIHEQKLAVGQRTFGIFVVLGLILISITVALIQYVNSRKLKELNDELERKNEELFLFAHTCSTNLISPIQDISSQIQSAQTELSKEDLEPKYDEYFGYVFKGLDTLGTIVESLKAISEIEGKQSSKLEKKYVPVISIYESATNNLEVLIRESGAEISFQNETYEKDIFTSPYGLVLVLQNMIHNAIKYNKAEHPIIHISYQREDGTAKFLIKDNGIGIDPQYHEYIFKAFKTLDNKSKINSSGLGLAICKKIVEQMGGEIKLKSTPGKGSTFFIILE